MMARFQQRLQAFQGDQTGAARKAWVTGEQVPGHLKILEHIPLILNPGAKGKATWHGICMNRGAAKA